ncbi:MAG: TIGR02996 domain-containing protein, partial [Myxococcota bacterium]
VLQSWVAGLPPQRHEVTQRLRLKDRIRALDSVLGPLRPTVRRGGHVSHALWLRREAAGHPADVPLLMAILTLGSGRPSIRARLQRLASRPPDPRIYAELVERLADRGPRDPTYTPSLVRHVDPHGPAPIVGTTLPPAVRKAMADVSVRPIAEEAHEALEGAVEAAVRRPRKRVWTQYAQPEPSPQREALWRAVVAAPDEDGPRFVFSDHLADTEPDLARFVQLQLEAVERDLTPAEVTHVRKVLRERVGDLLGPLGGAVHRQGLIFERGFLHTANVLTPQKEARALGDDFRWRTARALACGYGPFYQGDGVADLEQAGTRFVRRALASGEVTWVLHMGGAYLKAAPLRQLAKLGAVPRWRVLQYKVGLFDDTWDSLALPELETLVVECEVIPSFAQWPSLRELVLRIGPNLTGMSEANRLTHRIARDTLELATAMPLERLVVVTFSDLQLVFDGSTPEGRLLWTHPRRPPDPVVEVAFRRVLPAVGASLAAAGLSFRPTGQ